MPTTPRASAQFSVILRVTSPASPGPFAALIDALEAAGGVVGDITLIPGDGPRTRDVVVDAATADHAAALADVARGVADVTLENVTDRTFLLHDGGKIVMGGKSPLRSRDELSMLYTPGVARVSRAVADDVSRAWELTIKRNTVAVVSDGTAVLGLGDIGPEGAMPVMEGKALLFKEFGNVDSWPIVLSTKVPDEIVATVAAIAPGFGGINLEDISAPRCFEVEERLKAMLDIPVFHDDQHGTAIVVLAALLNALKVVGKRPEDVKVVLTGTGSAGVAVTYILLNAGITNVIGCDEHGSLHTGRTDLDPWRARYAERTNPHGFIGSANEALAGADIFIGVSVPGAISRDAVATMNDGAIVCAMANPNPEVMPEEIAGLASVIATGRSDYPNQINNVLAFPGVFRGALDVRARAINEEMKLAAANAIASVITESELRPDYVIPSPFDARVAPAVAAAVANAARATGVAR